MAPAPLARLSEFRSLTSLLCYFPVPNALVFDCSCFIVSSAPGRAFLLSVFSRAAFSHFAFIYTLVLAFPHHFKCFVALIPDRKLPRAKILHARRLCKALRLLTTHPSALLECAIYPATAPPVCGVSISLHVAPSIPALL
ncbi:hypothetical protein DFH09DRAFT_554345 [Mycena vulgaris]|nr:hypothetical protein DFH09DRAFT_554345 [Mycena vulgaris]